MRYYLTLIRMAIFEMTRDNNASEDVEKMNPQYTISGNVNWYSHYGKQEGNSSRS